MSRKYSLLVSTLLCSGCASTWHTVQASPPAAMAAHRDGDVRVTRQDGSMVTLHQVAGATFGALFVLNVIAAPNGGIGGT